LAKGIRKWGGVKDPVEVLVVGQVDPKEPPPRRLQRLVKAATYGTKASYYKWSPSALDVDRMKEHELYHSVPFRH
jgi:hypothetical protein